jgi:hypothetical protein
MTFAYQSRIFGVLDLLSLSTSLHVEEYPLRLLDCSDKFV